ncbi:hypothetical protein BUALT_Bualt09G0058600 [Buddleja alternifolia]|uniref:Beta-glucosidase n=1 Tax=Buddleja alternifolia TaxID=168488 RepID=A0AAV6WZM4_9LAMI|nr:hypothetical protein BUALT_Bualt09G0058600 [Buddleja alternifolia]
MQGVVSVIPSAMEYQNSLAIVSPKSISKEIDSSTITRNDFPDGFLFGTSTSAYQVEGSAAKDGRRKIDDRSNGNVAADMYSKYKEDIIAMKNMGFDAYRFSICWTRILPGGHRNLGVNREGIKFYSDLIDMIIANGMEPFVTVFHFDLPQVLQAEYGGFLSKKVVKDFCDYAEVCFWEFGDRVKYWILINEPWTYAVNGYVMGTFPPGQASAPAPVIANNIHAYRGAPHPELIKNETKLYTSFKASGNPGQDVYTVGRNLLLAHAAAAQSYRTKFQAMQKGKIGISLNCNWYEPYSDSVEDTAASKRAVDFMIGWFLSPLLTGKYPQTMIDNVQDNLAPFTDKESDMLKGSLDFLGLNYYTAMYARDDPKHPEDEQSYMKDMHLETLRVDEENKLCLTSLEACVDPVRIQYHQDHLAYLLKAMKNLDNPVDVHLEDMALKSTANEAMLGTGLPNEGIPSDIDVGQPIFGQNPHGDSGMYF